MTWPLMGRILMKRIKCDGNFGINGAELPRQSFSLHLLNYLQIILSYYIDPKEKLFGRVIGSRRARSALSPSCLPVSPFLFPLEWESGAIVLRFFDKVSESPPATNNRFFALPREERPRFFPFLASLWPYFWSFLLSDSFAPLSPLLTKTAT